MKPERLVSLQHRPSPRRAAPGLEIVAIVVGLACAAGMITFVAIGLAYIFDSEVSLWLWYGSWWLLMVANHLRILILKRLCALRALSIDTE